MLRKPQAGIWLTHLYIIQVIICHHQNTSNYSIQNSTTKDRDFSYATSHGVPNERRDFGFSRIPLKENVLHPYRTRKTCTTEFEESRITVSDYGKDSFLGLVADLSTHLLCSRTWWSTFTSHHIFHCKQRTETSPLHVLFFTNCHSLLTLSLQIMLFIQEWLNIFGKPFRLINERLWNKNSKSKLSHAYKINSIEDSESS